MKVFCCFNKEYCFKYFHFAVVRYVTYCATAKRGVCQKLDLMIINSIDDHVKACTFRCGVKELSMS